MGSAAAVPVVTPPQTEELAAQATLAPAPPTADAASAEPVFAAPPRLRRQVRPRSLAMPIRPTPPRGRLQRPSSSRIMPRGRCPRPRSRHSRMNPSPRPRQRADRSEPPAAIRLKPRMPVLAGAGALAAAAIAAVLLMVGKGGGEKPRRAGQVAFPRRQPSHRRPLQPDRSIPAYRQRPSRPWPPGQWQRPARPLRVPLPASRAPRSGNGQEQDGHGCRAARRERASADSRAGPRSRSSRRSAAAAAGPQSATQSGRRVQGQEHPEPGVLPDRAVRQTGRPQSSLVRQAPGGRQAARGKQVRN